MRSLLSLLAGLIAVVALAVALPAAWVDRNVAEEDGYVALSRSLLEDEETRGQLISSVADQLDASARDLAEQNGIPSSAVPDVRSEVEAAADEVLKTDQAVDAWAESQRLSWQAMFADPEVTPPGFVVTPGPLVAVVADAVGVRAGETGGSVTLDDPAVQRAVQRAEQADTAWRVAAAVAVVGAVVSLLAARRRLGALAWLGVGAVLAAAAVWVGAELASGAATLQSDGLAAAVGGAVVDAATASLDDWLVVTAVVGAVVAVVGMIGSAVAGRRG